MSRPGRISLDMDRAILDQVWKVSSISFDRFSVYYFSISFGSFSRARTGVGGEIRVDPMIPFLTANHDRKKSWGLGPSFI